MSSVVVVANEPPSPVVNGGRARIAALVRALADVADVTVLAPTLPGGEPATRGDLPAEVVALPPSRTPRLAALAGSAPRIGARVLDPVTAAEVERLVVGRQADAVVVSHSYLVPRLPGLASHPCLVVDFPNLETARTRSAARRGPLARRAADRIEAAKADRWEPRVARTAALCLAVDDTDAAVLRGWGAAAVAVVGNASDAQPCGPSPVDGPLLAVADWSYAPNRRGLDAFLATVWPRLHAARSTTRLVLAGRGAPTELPPGVTAAGFVPDLGSLYSAAAAVIAPVEEGAGTQLKVVDAVARGRVVAVTPYGARSLPGHARGVCPAALEAEELARLLDDVADRHRREAQLCSVRIDWAASTTPLRHWVAREVSCV